ncbi:hypothetical protein [Alkalihalobacillus sp. BA299]|uniref:hypothetical protein n=1 Tax=Alkalihalobacillus sp. BA299 TaxID=2815938 RepID=UPI001ADB07C8|nr:hypothetical protein [Alkalihalobacillus sp. BA299]
MKSLEKANEKSNGSMKNVNSIQQIVSNLIKQGINASIVRKPASISFIIPDGN